MTMAASAAVPAMAKPNRRTGFYHVPAVLARRRDWMSNPGRAHRGGDDSGQNQGCEHCGPHSVVSKSFSGEQADPGQPGTGTPILACRTARQRPGYARSGMLRDWERMRGRSGLG